MTTQAEAICAIHEAAARIVFCAYKHAQRQFANRERGMPRNVARELDACTNIMILFSSDEQAAMLRRLAQHFNRWKFLPGEDVGVKLLFDFGYALEPLAHQLISLVHLTRAYPKEVIRRAAKLDPKKAIEKANA